MPRAAPDHPWRREFRLSPPPQPSVLTPIEVTAVRQAHANGLTKASIARIYDVNWHAVNYAVKHSTQGA